MNLSHVRYKGSLNRPFISDVLPSDITNLMAKQTALRYDVLLMQVQIIIANYKNVECPLGPHSLVDSTQNGINLWVFKTIGVENCSKYLPVLTHKLKVSSNKLRKKRGFIF